MTIIVRYEIHTKWTVTPEMREFETQRAANWFLDQHLPKDAKNIDIWIEDKTPRQAPTWYTAPKSHHPWWDANKRPFSDRFDPNEQKDRS